MSISSPTVISLFSGAGGIDYGLEAAGFETRVAVEMNRDCCETLRANRSWPVIEGDILGVSTKEILRAARLKVGEADLLVGGPPCQPFSKAGYWARGDSLRLDDPRANTLAAYLRVLREARPRAFVLENVEGLAYEGKSEGMRLLLDAIDDINKRTKSKYRVSFRVINTADYGVPQLRQRLIMVGSIDGKVFQFPEPTHGEASDLFHEREPYRTAWDAIGDLDAPVDEDLAMKGKWAALLPSIPEGKNYLFHTDRGGGLPLFGWRRRYWSFLLKLAKDRPSWTIQAQPGPAIGPFHWTNRRLSTRELCRLQTFPDDIRIVGSRISIQKQLGNAVPSLLAEVLGREIKKQLLGQRVRSAKPALLPPVRLPIPAPELLKSVPPPLVGLAGEHTPHPGTGQGTLALQRTRAEA